MKKFIIKGGLFGIPIGLFFLVPIYILYLNGEIFTPIDNLIKSNKPYLVGYSFNEENYRYLKVKEIENNPTPKVMALGSSRILQFREQMFSSPFYNAGYTIYSISDFVPFLKNNLKSEKPEVLIINLDQWMFNGNWDSLDKKENQKAYQYPVFNTSPSIASIKETWSYIFKGKINYTHGSDNKENNKIGLNANNNDTGFRKDGSMRYGIQIKKLIANDSSASDYQFNDTYKRINSGNKRFEYGTIINPKAILEVKKIISFCKKNNIYLIAILPPFADAVNSKITNSGNYKYINDIYSNTESLFKANNYELWDLSNLSKYKSNDSEVIDGFHGSEVTYLKMLIYMVENGSKIKDYTLLKKLKSDLSNQPNRYTIYND